MYVYEARPAQALGLYSFTTKPKAACQGINHSSTGCLGIRLYMQGKQTRAQPCNGPKRNLHIPNKQRSISQTNALRASKHPRKEINHVKQDINYGEKTNSTHVQKITSFIIDSKLMRGGESRTWGVLRQLQEKIWLKSIEPYVATSSGRQIISASSSP